MTGRTAGSRRALALAVLLVVPVILTAVPAADVAASTASRGISPRLGLVPRSTSEKPAQASIPAGHSRTRMHLKFAEGTLVRLRGGGFVTQGTDDLTALRRVFRKHPGIRVERLFDRPEVALSIEKFRIELESGREQADKNLYYRLIVPRGADEVEILDDLNALDIVELAAAEPLPGPEPTMHGTTPSFIDQQTYREAAPAGIDADFANGVPGGTGGNVRVIDIERGWNRTHEDLSKLAPASALVENGTAQLVAGSRQHGTAVMGEIVGDDNGRGVIGIAHGAAAGISNAQTTDGYELEGAIDAAHAALTDGDVILLEQQIAGPNGCDDNQVGCVAVEWNQTYYDAIVAATSDGIIVVEAAGNGAQDLDDSATYGSPFPDGRADSGAIIVGAGSSPDCVDTPHGRLDFSNHGSRVDVQGYGHCIVTTGYGDLQADADDDFWYTNTFGGTSGASPIVTGAAVVLSSIAQEQGDADGLSSVEARGALASTGTPQATGAGQLAGNIGPLPNLASALEAYLPVADAGGPYATVEGTDVVLSAAASTDPQGAALTYDWDLDDNGTFETSGAAPAFTDVGRDASLTVRLRVTDAGGATDVDTATVNVGNVAPSVSLVADAPQDEGAPVTVSATIADPGWLEDLDATIDWGDGSASVPVAGSLDNTRPDATLTFDVARRFGDNGIYAAEVCGSDDDTTTCETIDLQIDNVAPAVTVDVAQVAEIDEGEVAHASATFADPGWLDGYGGEVDWGTSAFASSAATIVDSDQRPDADTGTATASKQYGDNGTFTVTTTVTDDDAGSGSDAFDLTVNNVAPTATIDESGTTVVNGVPTIISNVGQDVDFSARSTDPGSDDLYLSWDWDDGAPAPDVSTPYLLQAPLFDLLPSPNVAGRDETDPQVHAFSDACMYDIGFASLDDDSGQSDDAVKVLIGGNADEVRTAGYWHHHYRPAGSSTFDAATLGCYLEITGFVSLVLDEVTDASTIDLAYSVLSSPNTVQQRLDRQLLTALLNFANGAVGYDEALDLDGDGVADTTFDALVATAEAVRLDPGATSAQLLEQKDRLEAFNRGL